MARQLIAIAKLFAGISLSFIILKNTLLAMKALLYIVLIGFLLTGCKSQQKEEETTNSNKNTAELAKVAPTKIQVDNILIDAIGHASSIIEYDQKVIYIDPSGGANLYTDKKPADIVLITDIHGDHMNIETLNNLDIAKAKIVVPQAVAEKLPAYYTEQLIIINNGETKEIQGVPIEAIPMYNLREEALKFHPKGRGNGYVVTLGSKRLYFSGDTEDISEMRALKAIDIAFVTMNLPYTMTVENAADAVLAFKPKQVYPYHYRSTKGLSDVVKFKELVAKDPTIEVVLLDWYPTID
ncbi:MBL fold metallo-hydrolase [Aquimarina sp. 2201CG1-2-11]|uniref:MBL fold metallo-hydrolase n=1 Tax=Aquimarina discodermiae TaxID=3231043 RepID=UPI003462C65C